MTSSLSISLNATLSPEWAGVTLRDRRSCLRTECWTSLNQPSYFPKSVFRMVFTLQARVGLKTWKALNIIHQIPIFLNQSRSEAQEHCRQRPLSPPQGFFGPSKAQAKISSVHVRQLRSLSFCAYPRQRPQPQCGPFLLEQSRYSGEGLCSKSHKLSHKILCKVTSTISLSVSRA